MKLVSKYLLFISILFFVYFFLLLSLSSLPMNEFDGALRLLSQYYTSAGLVPYIDFGVVYPPGYFILIGYIFKYISIFQRNIIFSVFYAVIFYFYIKLFLSSIKGSKYEKLLKLSIFFISLTFITTHFFYYDLLSIIIIPIYLIFVFLKEKKYSKFLYILLFLIPFLRWDVAIIIFIVSSIDTFYSLIILKDKKYFNQSIFIPISILTGFVLLFLFLIFNSNLEKAYDFIVNIPTFVIKPYRNLPIPPFKFRPFENMMFYTTVLLIFAFIYTAYKFIKSVGIKKIIKYKNLRYIYIPLLLTIFLLPYFFGRISFHHSIPIWYLIIIFLLIYTDKINKYVLFISLVSFIPFITYYKNNLKYFNFLPDNIQNIYDINSYDCSRFSEISADSIFVGRLSYNNFDYSNAYIYYLYKYLKPATPYISDEPGIQDSCKYGEIIKNQLIKSEKPMLAFIATNPQTGFQNIKLKSCGKIEKYLGNNKYQMLGKCQSYNFDYEVRLYK